MGPNIFQIATKELNQDAFLTWLLQWADLSNEQHDKQLHLCARRFVKSLLQAGEVSEGYEVKKVVAGRQWEKIDVWAEVNDEYLIIIEDKTFTGEHSEQLQKYKSNAEKWCKENNYKLVCIYLKTGSEPQASLKKIQSKGFSIFSRKDLLKTLSGHPEITNNIFTDFLSNLQQLDKSYDSFTEKIIEDWDDNSWVGFYQLLEGHFEGLNWFLVNNPAGGFWGAITTWEKWGDFAVYIQIEQGRLCFKISFSPDDIWAKEGKFNPDDVQDRLYASLLEGAKIVGLSEIRRPAFYRHHGTYRTVAIVDRKDWLGEDLSKIDTNRVVATLQNYNQFLAELTKSVEKGKTDTFISKNF